jgi:hypothetical protein
MRRKALILIVLLWTLSLDAGTVRLYNNSNVDLRVVVRGSDGSIQGELVVKAQNFSTWTDSYIPAGGYRGPILQNKTYDRTMTPYVVEWYCMDGKDYAVCDTVSTGAVVMATNCSGARSCTPKKKEVNPNIPQNQTIQPEWQKP